MITKIDFPFKDFSYLYVDKKLCSETYKIIS